jgi:hypothetical protein
VEVTIRYADTPRVFGAIVVRLRAMLLERCGADVVAHALTRLPREDRAEFEEASEEVWCRGTALERVMIEVAREVKADPVALTAVVVHDAIRATVGTLWRALLVVTSDYTLLRRTPMFYARSYDRGSLSGERKSPGRALLCLEGWDDIPELHSIAIAAGVRGVLEAAGRKDVAVSPRREGRHVYFDVTWKP